MKSFFPFFLTDEWRDQAALDAHSKSKIMETSAALREKYKLKMRVNRYLFEK